MKCRACGADVSGSHEVRVDVRLGAKIVTAHQVKFCSEKCFKLWWLGTACFLGANPALFDPNVELWPPA